MLIHNGFKIRNLRKMNGKVDGVLLDIFIMNEWITIGSIDVCPTCNELTPMTKVLEKSRHFIIGGDFNSRDPAFKHVSANTLGGLLLSWATNIGGIILNPISPTCFQSVDGSFIDKFIIDSNTPVTYSAINNITSFSDHNGITMTIHCPATDLNITNGFILRQFDKANTVRMNRYLESELGKLMMPLKFNLLPGALETLATNVNEILSTTVDRLVPTTFIPMNGISLSRHTRTAIREYHRKQRRAHRLRTFGAWLPDILMIRNEIRLLRTMVQNAFRSDLSNHYRDQLRATVNMNDAY